MQFRHLIETLKKDYSIQVIQEEISEKITDIQLLDSSQTNYDPQILYVGNSNTVSACTVLPEQLITTKKPVQVSAVKNYAVIDSANLPAIFNKLHTLFYQSLQLSNDFSQLIAMSIRGDSAQSIVNAASQKLGNPIIIIDNGFKVLYYSNLQEIQDTLWKENIHRGYCTYEFIKAVNELPAAISAPDNSSTYRLCCPDSPNSKLCSKIFWNNSQIGYAIMLEEQTPIHFLQWEMLSNISYVISDILSKSPNFSGIYGSVKNILLYQLLENQNPENISIRMKASKITPPEHMCCLVVARDTLINPKQWESFASEQLRLVFPDASLCIYEDYIVILAALKDSFGLRADILERLQNLLPKISKNIYISQTYENIYQTRLYYEQCVFLKNLSLKLEVNKSIMHYDNYGFYNLLSQISDSKALLKIVNPALKTLRDYDHKNNTSLYDTLKTYIQCQYNATKTAAALYIHRNSFTYRMEKIEELTQINLNDSNQLFHLSIGYYIEDYLS